MRVLILPQGARCGGSVELRGPDYHYLVHVLRLERGERLRAGDGRGGLWQCRIAEVGPDRLRLDVESAIEEPAPSPAIRLIQALPKGRKMDLIVRGATEGGITVLEPVFSRHSLAKVGDPLELERKVERWRRIAREAAQQSGGSCLPAVLEPVDLERALEREPEAGEVRLIFHQDRLGGDTLHGALAGHPQSVTIAVGPEGGFSAEEMELARARSFLPIALGRRVWRAETAALFAVAAVQCILEEREAWEPA